MRKLLAFMLLLAAPVGATPLLIQPRAVSPIIMPLVRPLTRLPLFDITFGRPGGGSGGGGWGTQPSSNGCITRTGSNTFSAVTFAVDAGLSIVGGDCQSGTITYGLDLSVASTFSSGTSSVAATGTVGTFYFETDRPAFYLYPATDTEHWGLSIAAGQAAGALFQTSATDTLAAITSTDDNALVGDGSTWAKKALPDCDDSGGNHLNYDTSTNAYSCGTSGGGATFDPSTQLFLYDDFLSGTATNGQLGSSGGVFTATASGTVGIATGSAEHPGLIRISSHATNDNSGAGITFNNAASATTYDVYTTHEWQIDTMVLFGANSTAITNTALYVGLTPSLGDPDAAGAGIWIRHDSDDSDTTFIFAVCNASGAGGCAAAGDAANQKTVASTITPSAGTYYRFRIARCATCGPAGVAQISMRVNNETAKTFCSSGCDGTLGTIPASGNLGENVIYLTRTTTGVMSSDLDYMYLNLTGLTRN